MISFLLVPFMCLSMAQEGAKTKGDPFSINEITSTVNYGLGSTETEINPASITSVRDESATSHGTYSTAESIGTFGTEEYNFGIRGRVSNSNKKDLYSFSVIDRTLVNLRFMMRGGDINGELQTEGRKKISEFKYGSESDNPTVLLKKGFYFIVVENLSEYDAGYTTFMASKPAQTDETITIDTNIMKKYKALVWESDYVPGGVDPIDGTIIKSEIKLGRKYPLKIKGGLYSCKVGEQFLARSIYIWSNDVFDLLRKDICAYRDEAIKILQENKNKQKIAAVFSNASKAAGAAAFICRFVPVVGGKMGAALKTLSFASSLVSFLIENSTQLIENDVIAQCLRVLGALDKADEGKIISLKQNVIVKYYGRVNQYTKRRIWRIKYVPYSRPDGKDYSVVERNASSPYPTYDMKLHRGDGEEIVSDCQGTFKAYTSIKDIDFKFGNGDQL